MLNLSGRLDITSQALLNEYTRIRFKENNGLLCPDALSIYEQNFLPEEEIKKLCEEAYKHELFEPIPTFVPDNVIKAFEKTGCVPIQIRNITREVYGVYLPDLEHIKPEINGMTVTLQPTTPYFYFKYFMRYYGRHNVLLPIPIRDIFDAIVEEGTRGGAADITLSSAGKSAEVYYNIRKKKVYSHRLFTSEDMVGLINLLFYTSPFQFESRMPQYVGVELNKYFRGRVVASPKYHGYTITIRILPKRAFESTFEDLNLKPTTIDWLQNKFLDGETGLHLIVGSTMSGKNTTALACLRELVLPDKWKIISVEMPVEQELGGVEQISCEDTEEYKAHCEALIRENPDYVYITEMNDMVGEAVIKTANTGKCVITTLHANGVADTLTRLQDITGLSVDRLLFNVHSVMYQELRRDDSTDTVYPYDRFLRFDKEVKMKLFGKSLGEMARIINELEEGD